MPRPMILPFTLTPMPATGPASMRSSNDVTSSTASNVVVGYRIRCFQRKRPPDTAIAKPTENTEWNTTPRIATMNRIHGATAMPSWLQYADRNAACSAGVTVAVDLNVLHVLGAAPG